jgi:hypothetical protein
MALRHKASANRLITDNRHLPKDFMFRNLPARVVVDGSRLLQSVYNVDWWTALEVLEFTPITDIVHMQKRQHCIDARLWIRAVAAVESRYGSTTEYGRQERFHRGTDLACQRSR